MELNDDEQLTFLPKTQQDYSDLIPSRKNSYNPDNHQGLVRLEQIRSLGFFKRNFRKIDNGSLRGTIITWVRIAMGIGVFAIPYFISIVGLTTGLIFIVLAALINYTTFLIIFEASEHTNLQTYPDIVRHLFGDSAFKFFRITMFMEYLSVTLLYALASWSLFQLYGQQFGIFKEEQITDKINMTYNEYDLNIFLIRALYFFILYILISKLLLADKMESQQLVSTAFVFVVIALLIINTLQAPEYYQYYENTNQLKMTLSSKTPSLKWLGCFFAILLTFNTQVMCLDMKKELFHPTLKRLKKVTSISIFTQCTCALIIAIAGYASLGDKFVPSLLFLKKQIPNGGILSIIDRILNLCFFVLAIVGISILNVPIRRFLLQMQNQQLITRSKYRVYSLVPMAIIFIIATLFPFISQVINFFGLSIYNINAYLIPFYIKYIILKQKGQLNKARIYIILFYIFLILSIIGTLHMFFGKKVNQFIMFKFTLKRIIKSIIFVLMIFYYYVENFLIGKQPPNFNNGVDQLKLLDKQSTVLNEQGYMTNHGFSKIKISNFNKNQIKGLIKNFKYKKFDHFTFITKNHLIHFSVINMNYVYNLSLSVYDKKQNKKIKISLDNYPFVNSAPQISDDLLVCQSYSFIKGDQKIFVNKTQEQNLCKIEIKINTKIFNGKFNFKLDPEEENLFEHLKVNDTGSNWFYGGKYLNQKCIADFKTLNKDIKDYSCLALIDEGRSVYNYKTEYIWATGASYLKDGRSFSFNIGQGMMHPSSNGLTQFVKIEDRVIPLNPLIYIYDKERDLHIFQTHQNFQKEQKNTAVFTFQKLKDNSHGQNLLFIKAQLQLQYGIYFGWVKDEQGNQIIFENVIGLFEDAKFRW